MIFCLLATYGTSKSIAICQIGQSKDGSCNENSFAHMADPAAPAEKSSTFQEPFKGLAKYQGQRKTSPSAGRQWSTCARFQLLKSQEQAKLFDDSKMGGRGPEMFLLMIRKGPPAPMLNGNPDQHFLISVSSNADLIRGVNALEPGQIKQPSKFSGAAEHLRGTHN